jgi:anti-sigma factor RsiW
MNDPLDQQLQELGWRQPLTDAGKTRLEQHLAAHPEHRAELDSELQLTRLLDQLPDAPPVASNFTAQVLQAIERENRAAARPRPAFLSRWRAWLPRVALACLVVSVGIFTLRQQQLQSRQLLAQRIATMAQAVPDPEMVKDFNTIRLLADEPPKADTDLLAAMQ